MLERDIMQRDVTNQYIICYDLKNSSPREYDRLDAVLKEKIGAKKIQRTVWMLNRLNKKYRYQ